MNEISLSMPVARCPECDSDVYATVTANGGEIIGEKFVVGLRVTALTGCPHVTGWRPDGDDGEPLPVDKAA